MAIALQIVQSEKENAFANGHKLFHRRQSVIVSKGACQQFSSIFSLIKRRAKFSAKDRKLKETCTGNVIVRLMEMWVSAFKVNVNDRLVAQSEWGIQKGNTSDYGFSGCRLTRFSFKWTFLTLSGSFSPDLKLIFHHV